jgi:hypothetical protein
MSAVNFADLYAKDVNSDLNLRFGSRTFKAYKEVLCGRSTYFMKSCGWGGQFNESNQAVIELIGDDEDAVHGWLCWLYAQDYERVISSIPRHDRLFFDVELFKVSDKYLQLDLTPVVQNDFSTMLRSTSNGCLLQLYDKVTHELGCESLLEATVVELRERLEVLLTTDWFPGVLKSEPELMLRLLKREVESRAAMDVRPRPVGSDEYEESRKAKLETLLALRV